MVHSECGWVRITQGEAAARSHFHIHIPSLTFIQTTRLNFYLIGDVEQKLE